ncbi:MAG: TrmH family RNA methyltransferase [Betaproteobacteria bacterium]
MKLITSAANPAYRRWLRLATVPRAVRAEGATLAEGLHLAAAALAANAAVEAVLLRRGERASEVAALVAQTTPAPVYELSAELFDRLGLVERGVGLALVLRLPTVAAPPAAGDAIYLEGVQDPGNAGTLLRLAAAAGVRQVYAGPGTAALWSPRVLRAGPGAHFRLHLDEDVALDSLPTRLAGPWIGTVVRDAPPLWETALPAGPLGWMFGSEGQGLSAPALARCALRVRIPLAAAVESLNVAAAAAVCLFERQRRLSAPSTR